MSGESVAAGSAVARPRIGADRFRALAERLKNPAGAVVPPLDIATTSVAPIAVPAMPPPVVHAPAMPEVLVAASPVTHGAPLDHGLHAAVIPENAVLAPATEPSVPPQRLPEFIQEPLPPPATEEVAAATFAPEPAVAVAPESAPVPEMGPEPVSEPVQDVLSQPAIASAPEPVAQPQPSVSPLARILAAEHRPVPQVALPEILPPPAPPPPPRVIEENGETIVLEPPSMEVVQERLREDATTRLHQLDIDNIWRQVLATPTLEERAEFLREAAEIMAAEQGHVLPAAEIAAEHDLSRIEGVAEAEQTLPGQPQPVVSYTEDEQLETAELARSLLDMMASGSSSGLPHERALAADTLLRLLPKLAAKPLAMLSQRLAMMDNPPQLLVAKLIRDDRVEVSGPLLEDCMHITDQDLAMVVAEDNPGKRRMVARRRRLSRAISDKLIATDDPSVLLTLVRNANAEISHDGFNALIEAAARHDELMAPLSTRADLGAPHAFELFWPAPPQLRRYLLHRFLTDSETLTKILKITLSTQSFDEGKEDINLPSPGDVMEYLEIACRGRMETASQRLGDALGVDAAAIHRILLDRVGEALVVLLKAAGFPRSNVGDLLPALKRGEIALLDPERDVTELQTMFDTLSLNKARILMTYWNWAVRKAGPYAPVH